jgi:hypothetical protein
MSKTGSKVLSIKFKLLEPKWGRVFSSFKQKLKPRTEVLLKRKNQPTLVYIHPRSSFVFQI